jgi:hypothetical protein
VAHELNHALQAATDFEEFAWAWEATAVYIEDEVYDDVNDYYWYIPYFQGYPQQNLVYFGTSEPYNIYPYGAAIFMHFLREGLPGADARLLASLWEASSQPDTTNEPDFLDAVDAAATFRGWQGLEEVYARFTLWRYFTGSRDDGAHFSEGGAWASAGDVEVPLVSQTTLSEEGLEKTLTGITELGAQYLYLDVTNLSPGKALELRLDGDSGTRWMVTASLLKGSSSQDCVLLESPEEGRFKTVLNLSDASAVVLGVANVGKDFDPEYVATDADISLKVVVEDADAGGCRCSQDRAGSDVWRMHRKAGSPDLFTATGLLMALIRMWLMRAQPIEGAAASAGGKTNGKPTLGGRTLRRAARGS